MMMRNMFRLTSPIQINAIPGNGVALCQQWTYQPGKSPFPPLIRVPYYSDRLFQIIRHSLPPFYFPSTFTTHLLGGGPQVERSGDAYTMNGLPGPGNGA